MIKTYKDLSLLRKLFYKIKLKNFLKYGCSVEELIEYISPDNKICNVPCELCGDKENCKLISKRFKNALFKR